MKQVRLILILVFLFLGVSAVGATGLKMDFRATMTGSQEVPAVRTMANGAAKLTFNEGFRVMRYKMQVNNIETPLAAHIHCAPAGQNGPVGVTLMVKAGAVHSAVTAPDPGNACGWHTLADVQMAMQMGYAYINVHSAAVPSGEIRGQIR